MCIAICSFPGAFFLSLFFINIFNLLNARFKGQEKLATQLHSFIFFLLILNYAIKDFFEC